MKKGKLACCLLAASILMSGCSYTQTGIEALLQPPKLSEEQNEIYAALTTDGNKNIRLVYPRTGSYTSAFLVHNLDVEPTNEAIVFYSSQSGSGGSTAIRINVMDQRDGVWYSTYDAGSVAGASEVEKVDFFTIGQQEYLTIGYNLTTSTDKVCVLYAFEDGKLSEKQRWNCANYIVYDLNEDRAAEIVTITTRRDASGSSSSVAELRRITNTGGSQSISTTELDPAVTEYKYITPGKLRDGRSALYLDGLRGTNVYTTEILTCEGQRMVNLIYSTQGESLIEQTQRPSGSPSVDINEDGVIEIPLRTPAPGYELAGSGQQEFLTEWYCYDMEQLELRKTTYAAYSLGYVFTIPEDWLGKVTVSFDSGANVLTLYEYANGRIGDSLADIKVVRASEYAQEATQRGYELLYDNGQIMYAYRINSAGKAIKMTAQRIENNFKLYKITQ